MVAITQGGRASTVTAESPFISSFLPKCPNLLQLQLPNLSFSRLSSSRCVAASTKQKKKPRSSTSAREWSYEHLMVVWDEVFEQCCTDPVKAAKIRDLSCNGLVKHGRGCVLVFQEVQTRPRGSGTGFTSKPPKSSRRVPDFVVLDWYAVYLPREFLLDPRKAPNEAEMAPQDGKSDMPETCKEPKGNVVQTLNSARDTTKDVTIDVEDIVRQAQDVYTFGSDDDDDDQDELDVQADDSDFNNENLLSWDSREEASAASSTNSEDLNEKKNDVVIPVSEPNNQHDAPLLFFDDDEAVLTTSSEAEMKSAKDISQDGVCVNVTDVIAQNNFAAEDGTLEIADGILVESAEVHRDYVIDDTYSDREKVNTNVRTAAGGKASLSESTLEGEACTGAHKASILNETGGYTVEVLQESNEADASHMNGASAKENAFTVGEGMEDQGGENDDMELATQQMLFTSMRGMDRTRLLSLTANFDFEAERFRFGRRMAMIDTKTMDAGGEDPYNPKEDELVLLLHIVVDGRPAYGADVVIAYRDETQTVGPEKDPWKLKAKYKYGN